MKHRVTFRASRLMLLLAALLLLPMAAQAEFYYSGLYFEIGNDGNAYLLANPKGNKGDIAIPPIVVNSATGLMYIVTRIGDGAFKDNTEVTAIDMIAMNPAVSIGERTFKGCTGLKAAYLPINGLTTIGAEVFSGCSSLASITIPSNVTSISNTAFQGCTSLTQVTLSSNAIVSKDRNSGASMASIFGGQVQEYIIGGTGVTAIGNNAFNECSSLTSVTILNSVTSIGQSAFENCYKLASITIPKSVTSIGEDAFANCIKLAGIRVEEGNPVYDSRDNSDAIIETSTNTLIAGCKNTVIPNSVTSIGEDAFFGCEGLTAISIPESVESIGGYAFSGCLHLAEVTIPNSVTSIYGHAFDNCESLTSVISKIEEPFELRSGVFPASYNCVLYVPKGTRDAYIAAGWERWFRGGIVEMDDGDDDNIVFADQNVKDACVANWDTSGDGELSYTEAAAVTDLGQVFQYDTSIRTFDELQYFTGLKSIGYWDFNGCSALTSITIPNSVTSINGHAFDDCKSLASISIPNSVESIGDQAFVYCESLTSITIPNSVTSIGDAAFWVCTGLTSITIPNSVTSIGVGAFSTCTGLTSVNIPESVTSIGEYAFYDCTGLTSITIPNSVTSIGAGAFYNSNLTSVISEIKVPFAFGSEAFEDISPNCVLYVPKGTRDAYIAAGWTEEVFMGGIVEMDGGDDIREKMDVNGDKEVSTADVTAIYSYIINGESSGFTRDKANVNGDNDVNTADVTAIYNYIINGK